MGKRPGLSVVKGTRSYVEGLKGSLESRATSVAHPHAETLHQSEGHPRRHAGEGRIIQEYDEACWGKRLRVPAAPPRSRCTRPGRGSSNGPPSALAKVGCQHDGDG